MPGVAGSHARIACATMSSLPLPTPDNQPSPSSAASLPAPAFSPLYQQIKGLILQSLQALVSCCKGDERPDCPILDDLGSPL